MTFDRTADRIVSHEETTRVNSSRGVTPVIRRIRSARPLGLQHRSGDGIEYGEEATYIREMIADAVAAIETLCSRVSASR